MFTQENWTLDPHQGKRFKTLDINDQVLKTIRKIIRAIDLHSKQLEHHFEMTGSQAVIMREIQSHGQLVTGTLAQNVSLSHATLTGILNRLEKKDLVTRVRDTLDKRRVLVSLTLEGEKLLEKSPSLLQEDFIERFSQLQSWEQNQILSSLQRVAQMMNAESLDAAAMLTSGEIKI